jgi:hypothetical protein
MSENPRTVPITVGAGYMAAFIANDRAVLADDRVAFTPEELADALTRVAGAYLVAMSCILHQTASEIADQFVSGAQIYQRLVQH